MRVADGVRAAGAWIAVAAMALLMACGGGGGTSGTANTSASTTGGTSGTASTSASTTGVTNATISWAPPTENTSGSAVGALSGYRIYYGTASHDYTMTIDVPNPGLTTYVVDALQIGVTYYFAVAAISASGIESALSPEVVATIS
jgi:fibronectin type 3 domain-containing protein